MGIELVLSHKSWLFLNSMSVQSTLLEEIKQAQVGDVQIERIKVNVNKGMTLGFMENKKEIISFKIEYVCPKRWSYRKDNVQDPQYKIFHLP